MISFISPRIFFLCFLFCIASVQISLNHNCVQVGLLDIDICGPSVPHLMGVASSSIQQSPLGWIPVYPVLTPPAMCPYPRL